MKHLKLFSLVGLIFLNCENRKKDGSENFNLSVAINKKLDSINNISQLIIENPSNQQDQNKNDSITRKTSLIIENIIKELFESYGKTPTDSILNALKKLDNSGYIPDKLYSQLTKKDLTTDIGKRAHKEYQAYLKSVETKQNSLERINLLSEEFSLNRIVEKDTILLRDLLISHKGYKVLDFWATWCAPCRSFNKRFQNKYIVYKDKGIEFYGIGVKVDSKKEKEAFLVAVKNDNTPWNQFVDFDNKIYDNFATNTVPFQVLLDEKNRIIKILSHDIEKELDEILK